MRPLILLLLIWFQFSIVTVNYRAIAMKRYLMTGATDFVIAICGFTIFKLIGDADSVWDVLGYAIGAVKGGLTGIWLTRKWEVR
jgi:hypothetical protein